MFVHAWGYRHHRGATADRPWRGALLLMRTWGYRHDQEAVADHPWHGALLLMLGDIGITKEPLVKEPPKKSGPRAPIDVSTDLR